MRKRYSQRFTKRLEVTFTSEGSKFRGISSDLSAMGLFIRTQHGLTPESFVDIELYLPNGKISRLRGIVKRTVKTALSLVKNGMGVELVARDQDYLEFLRDHDMLESTPEGAAPSSDKTETGKSGLNTDTTPESVIVSCPNCKVKNRISSQKLSQGAKCGKCGAVLEIEATS
ncbi:MAG TPA: PilZ domain-containing protein [Thermodesulfovibrionales bacterium]|nr:PilZ domain-containing protein [Thermodesulfovibrionales bacterium]